MTGEDTKRAERRRQIFTALLETRLARSLGEVEAVLGRWRKNDATVFEAHATLLSHAARAERLIERLLEDGGHVQEELMRDAFDESLVQRDEFVELVGREPELVQPSPPASVQATGLPAKQDVMDRMLQEGPVLIQLDARKDGVDVPVAFSQDARLVLRLGYGLTPPIHDLFLDEDSVSATLTFGGVPHHCVVPWSSVYAMVSTVSERRMVWPDDIPPEALAEVGAHVEAREEAEDAPPPPRRTAAQRRGTHLRLVK